MKFGVEHVALWTSTPGDIVDGKFVKVTDWAEASRRWHSLQSNANAGRWQQWAMVMQRHKDGGVHYHACVVHREDVRGNLNFAALRKRDYRTANPALRAEWEFWRETAPKYGFGRVEFLPVYEVEGFGRYLARYLKREIGCRRKEDSKARLLRYSQSWERCVMGAFTWTDTRALRARERAEEVTVKFFGNADRRDREMGKAWKWRMRRLLWCAETMFPIFLDQIEQELDCYGGFEVAMQTVFAKFDLRDKQAREAREKLGL